MTSRLWAIGLTLLVITVVSGYFAFTTQTGLASAIFGMSAFLTGPTLALAYEDTAAARTATR